ncbi:pentatricopeptide repeat-containing protein At2g13420, mitochondrial-like [Andrographis paniculata]|uniref:pentatricopeptide repeat-containing protein At2g13420, mitochondrial-like n=1 Tax=Andrographis paniculata TaxID=175694 RepID=UPI0021E6F840|nr:pentatricopeptide repeat-containing protein At2g13420, mitochondrial-like [Andrographis paniculata]
MAVTTDNHFRRQMAALANVLRRRVVEAKPPHLRRLFYSFSDLEDQNPSPSPSVPIRKPSLPPRHPSPPADSLSQILIRHHNPYHHMESSLQLSGVSLSSELIHQTLHRLSHHSKIALAFFKYAQSHHPPDRSPLLDTAAFNIIIDILCKVRQFDVAWQMIQQMDTNGSNSDFTTFFVLIRRLISAGLTRTAIRTFYDMSAFLGNDIFEPQFSFLFCYLMDTLCKYGYVKVAMEVFNKEKYRLEADAKLYTVLIYGWCKVGRIDMGKKFLSEMMERIIEPNVVTYNVLLNGVCRRSSLHPEGRFERVIREAEKLFEQMRSRGLEPDVTSYSIVLHVYSRAHKPQLCLDKLAMMKENGICPTVATYTSVVKCLCSCGRMDDAAELLDEMVQNGISPPAETYNCFFKEYRGRKDVEGAMKLYTRMKEDDSLLSPDMHTYNILLGMSMQLGKMSLVWEIWEDMLASGIGPDLDAYTMLVHGLCERRKWRQACQFFVEMIEKGFLPQKITFETLYRGLIQADMLRTWRRLKQKLEEESITFGSEFKEFHLKPYKR